MIYAADWAVFHKKEAAELFDKNKQTTNTWFPSKLPYLHTWHVTGGKSNQGQQNIVLGTHHVKYITQIICCLSPQTKTVLSRRVSHDTKKCNIPAVLLSEVWPDKSANLLLVQPANNYCRCRQHASRVTIHYTPRAMHQKKI